MSSSAQRNSPRPSHRARQAPPSSSHGSRDGLRISTQKQPGLGYSPTSSTPTSSSILPISVTGPKSYYSPAGTSCGRLCELPISLSTSDEATLNSYYAHCTVTNSLINNPLPYDPPTLVPLPNLRPLPLGSPSASTSRSFLSPPSSPFLARLQSTRLGRSLARTLSPRPREFDELSLGPPPDDLEYAPGMSRVQSRLAFHSADRDSQSHWSRRPPRCPRGAQVGGSARSRSHWGHGEEPEPANPCRATREDLRRRRAQRLQQEPGMETTWSRCCSRGARGAGKKGIRFR